MTDKMYQKRIDDLEGIVKTFSLFTEHMCKENKRCYSCPFFNINFGKKKCNAREIRAFVEKQYKEIYKPRNV